MNTQAVEEMKMINGIVSAHNTTVEVRYLGFRKQGH